MTDREPNVEILRGYRTGTYCVCINNVRVAGPKCLGGGEVLAAWTLTPEQLRELANEAECAAEDMENKGSDDD